MSLKATGTPGYYELTVNLILDKRVGGAANNYESILTVHLFRKRDHVRMATISVPQTSTRELFGNNSACARLRDIRLLLVRYSEIIPLDADRFNSTDGYYAVWERCCRPPDTDNLQNAGETGTVFYLEFPAVQKSGTPFTNSSPDFLLPPAEYVCLNKPYQITFATTDPDGDQLQYELVTPLAGHTKATPDASRYGTGQSFGNYPEALWQSGFGKNKVLPANPALQIDPSSGKLTVTARQAGLYAFAVQVREFRDGVQISMGRTEYHLPVVDCDINTTPPPVITHEGAVNDRILRCQDTPVQLEVEPDTTFAYQWQKDGKEIAGATKPIISVKAPGKYSVMKRFIHRCGIDTTSKSVEVLAPDGPKATIVARETELSSDSDTIILASATTQTGLRYQWIENQVSMPGKNQPRLAVTVPGQYILLVSTADGRCTSADTLEIRRAPPLIKVFTANSFTPNGDGVNDTWEIHNISDVPDCEVTVFDRWGEIVFYSKGYNKPWDGTHQTNKVPAGIYLYVIRPYTRREIYRGTLHILY